MTQMLLRVKKSQTTPRLANTQGQALIEYVLMLIISVSLVLALMNQIFKPFGEFIQSYMGSYVACLLEYGELPTMGGDVSPADEDSECNQKFKAASLAEGRPPISGSGSTDSKGGSNKNSSTSGNSGEASGSGAGSGSGSYAGSASRGGGRIIAGGTGPSRGTESSGGAGDGKVVEIALDSGGNDGFFKSSRSGGSYSAQGRRVQSVAVTGLTEAEKQTLEKKAEGTNKTTVTSGEGFAPAPKKMIIKPPEQKTVIEEEKPLTIGNFIRYIFIAALIIALVIFIGGQALQMSKNLEK